MRRRWRSIPSAFNDHHHARAKKCRAARRQWNEHYMDCSSQQWHRRSQRRGFGKTDTYILQTLLTYISGPIDLGNYYAVLSNCVVDQPTLLAGPISGGGLTIRSGKFQISNSANSYSGTTIVDNGTLSIANGGRIASTSAVQINARSLTLTAGFTTAATITGAGDIVVGSTATFAAKSISQNSLTLPDGAQASILKRTFTAARLTSGSATVSILNT